MNKHTPGPWVAKGRYIGTTNHMSYIAECSDQNGNWTNEPMSIANARLIAAAPDLLYVLESVLADLEFGIMPKLHMPTIRAAIVKATQP